MKPVHRSNWIQMQPCGSNDVTLAFLLEGWRSSENLASCEILCLHWGIDPSMPIFQPVARLAPTPLYIEDICFCTYNLQEDYVILEDIDYLIIWNWREGTICRIDGDHHEWDIGSGFTTHTILPFVFIVPNKLRKVFVIEIPHLQPVGSPESLHKMRPNSTASYPFLDEIEGLGSSRMNIPDMWRPISRRSGLAIVRSFRQQSQGGPLLHILSFSSTSSTSHLPTFAYKVAASFSSDRHELNQLKVLEGVGILLLKSCPDSLSGEEKLETRFYPFSHEEIIGAPVSRNFDLSLPCTGVATPLCFVSGTALMKIQDPSLDPHTQLVGIISID
ncbi:hypothetical protein DL93DRAFT_2232025, partial [Clavulina sp. PMI_390]